jgi:predicted AlkP superfamily phosphohydrolase/phosphomutase
MPFASFRSRLRPGPVLLLALAVAPLALSAAPPRVVVLGFDGADHALVAKGVAEGRLPNLAALAAKGGFTALTPTIPAQTPVSWSTFSTGLSPGRTLIFDFLKRNPKTYRPEFAIEEEGKKSFLLGKGNRVGVPAVLGIVSFVLVLLLSKILRRRVSGSGSGVAVPAGAASAPGARRAASSAAAGTTSMAPLVAALVAAGLFTFIGIRISSLLPSEIPWPTNNRRGTPFWEEAGRKGIPSVVMHVPVTFPAVDYDGGRLLSGLGVTDVRGRVGTPSYYTSDPFFAPKNKNEFSVELVRLESNKGTIGTEVFGPYNKLFKEPPVIKTPMTLTVASDGGSLTVAPKGSAPVTLKVGEWSPWVVFTFPFNALVKMTGIGRFHLASLSPEIKLYLSPIHFNPADLPPSVKITAPGSLSKKLADRYGLYKTMGWQIDTWSMSEETIDEKTFLEDVDHTVEPFRKMMNDFLDEKDVRLFVQIYEFPDRVAHCFWRFLDPQHPAYDAAKAAVWAPAVERTYEKMDAIVGDAMKKLGPEDVLIVLSDHGFATWRRSVNYNTWLVQNGFMTLKGGDGSQPADLEMLFGQGEFWPNVDWPKTKAYAMGLGDIYVNLKGREGQGSVSPGAEYEAVRDEIKRKLVTLVDPKTGQRAVSRIFTREEAYGSFDADLIPDLFVTNTAGTRIGWQGSLGVVTKEMFEDNAQIWSGDHCSLDPAVVPGILFANRALPKDKQPAIADVPATIYHVLGVAPPAKLDGVPLF